MPHYFKIIILIFTFLAYSSVSIAECNFNCSSPKVSKTKIHSYSLCYQLAGYALASANRFLEADRSKIF